MRLCTTVLCALALSACATAQVVEDVSAIPSGFLSGRLERIDHVIEKAIADGEVHGAVALVTRNGGIAYHKAFGLSDVASGRAMRTDTIFRIASMTKAITTVGAMILYEQGRFQLNDPVARYLPEFANMRVVSEANEDGSIAATVPAERPIRIIDLLAHTAGISYVFIPSAVSDSYLQAGIIDGLTGRELRLAEQMKLLARQPLLFEPGTDFAYGLNTDLLGYLIEVVSGNSLDRFFVQHITGPLKMKDTHFYLPPGKADRLAILYAHVEGQGLVVSDGTEADINLDNPNYPIEGARTYFSGGAGLSSTASDYARFLQMLLNDGALEGVRILSRKSVQLMRTARVDWDDDQRPDFGLGFRVLGDLGKTGELGSVDTYSWGGAFNTSYWIDPREQLVGVLMTQARPVESNITTEFRTMVYQALE